MAKPTGRPDRKTFCTVVATADGQVFEYPGLLLAGHKGDQPCAPRPEEMIPLPAGSRLFTLPQALPQGFDSQTGRLQTLERLPRSWGGDRVQAVCAFMAPGYTRTLLPAAQYPVRRETLPLWAYTALGWCLEEERFYVAASQVDRNLQWQPDRFDDREVAPGVDRLLARFPDNRLLRQLARCALDYHCFAAKNLFLGRWEAPLPTSPQCNARCLGCLSWQSAENECCPSSQERITFVPTVQELVETAVPHLQTAENAIVSYGQGCEGDPILQADVICQSIRAMRAETARGTINFNSNASLPDKIDALAAAGLDSLRVSLNSAREDFYAAYYRPRGYRFADVCESLRRARQQGLFVMLNYLVFPGISDQQEEIDALVELIDGGRVDLIQMRNLCIDPQQYLRAMPKGGTPIGLLAMLEQIKQRVPRIQYGYFNRTRESFFPAGFEQDWPIRPSRTASPEESKR
ncbi:MAG: radical SAM protein [Desulfuromonas thiophila]|nr:radical SAM protein [Desulfuromonas thiophila]MDD3801326.1 radical SAM protein [Desulfuromonas thiophila]MDY0397241.1 radical SAM protein [Desulfuromonas thiophila]